MSIKKQDKSKRDDPDDDDDMLDLEEERGKYIASGLLPSLAPGGYSFRKLESAIKQTPDYYGRVRPLETTLLDVLGGIKIQPGGPVETRRQIFEIEEQMQKLKNNLSVIERHPGISPEEKQRQKEKIYQQLKELDTQRQRLALAIGKLPEQLKPREAILSMLKPKETVRIVEGKEEKGGVEELITRGKDKWQRAREIVEAEYYTKEEKQNLLREIGVDDYDEAEVDYFASQGGVELRAEYIKAKLEEIGDDKERLNKFWKLATTPRPNGKKLLTSTVAALLKEQGISVPSTGTGKKKKKVKFQIPSGATKVSPMKIKITMPKLTPPPEITPLTFKTGGIKISQQPTIRLRQIQKPTIKVSWR